MERRYLIDRRLDPSETELLRRHLDGAGWTATDDAGNIAECTQSVTVLAEAQLVVDIDLAQMGTSGALTRCIRFEANDCAGTVIEFDHEIRLRRFEIGRRIVKCQVSVLTQNN